VVGQVWGRIGADFYLLDQVRGQYDFDETVRAMEDLSNRWLESTAILVEAQALGAALVTHLKHKISGLIPITVKGSKELRALNCVPVWQSKNVYIPKPDDSDYAWVREYLQELLNFPNAANDDQVDATTLALNQLHGTLFPKSTARVPETSNTQSLSSSPLARHHYFIGWVPGRSLDTYTVLVFDLADYKVVHFGRFRVESIKHQLNEVSQLSRYYNGAVVRIFDHVSGALVTELGMRRVLVERVKYSKLEASYENLALLMEEDAITIPDYHELQAELDVFKSGFTFDGSADYSAQVAQQSGIHALCLVTYDISAALIHFRRQPSVYYSFDRDLIGDVHFSR
jgi:predicted phage terminase large subunit-like protein